MIKKTVIAAALIGGVLANSTLSAATATPETAPEIRNQTYIIALEAPLTASDAMLRRSLHVQETGLVAHGGRFYMTVKAPTRTALDAFLKGTGRKTTDAGLAPVQWTGSGYRPFPPTAVVGFFNPVSE